MTRPLDTGLAAPQRALVLDGVVAALSPLERARGGYLEFVGAHHAAISAEEDLDELYERLRGRAPAIAVALGRGVYQAEGMTVRRDRYRKVLDVHVYCASTHMRSREARQRGDVISAADDRRDPGVFVMLEHVEDLLMGTAIDGAKQLVPQDESQVYSDAAIEMWVQRYEIAVDRKRLRDKDVAELLEAIHSVRWLEGTGAGAVIETIAALETR